MHSIHNFVLVTSIETLQDHLHIILDQYKAYWHMDLFFSQIASSEKNKSISVFQLILLCILDLYIKQAC